MEKTFRKLLANEIDCRVATVKQPNAEMKNGGVSILLYKDARVDMRLLDEVFGCMGWKREHQVLDGRLYCTISVYDEKSGQWVSKQDVGVESYTEKEKGQASDSFKRAGFNWGIGRELYTAPFIWVQLNESEWKKTQNGCQPTIALHVAEIEYAGDDICHLVLKDKNGNNRFTWGKSNPDATLKQAIEELRACKSVKEVKVVWNKYPQFKTVPDFVEACTFVGNELKNE